MISYRDLALTLKNKDVKKGAQHLNIDDILSVDRSELEKTAKNTNSENQNFSSAIIEIKN